jgi:hypothetical protein
MAITFDKANRLIIIEAPATEVTIQDLINAIRDYEDELVNLEISRIADAYGKQDLGGGAYVGITLVLINNWRIKFEDRASWTNCFVRGGNLVAVNDYNNDPIATATNVNVIIAQSSSPTIVGVEPENIENAVWNATKIGHLTEGTLGKQLSDDVADTIWDELTSPHQTINTTGKALTDRATSAETVRSIAQQLEQEL